eukprot:175501_1
MTPILPLSRKNNSEIENKNGFICAPIYTYIAHKGYIYLEEAACDGITEGAAAELCHSAVFESAMKMLNKNFIYPLLDDIVVETLTDVENAAADIATNAAKAIHKFGKNVFNDEDSSDDCSITSNSDGAGIWIWVIVIIGVVLILVIVCYCYLKKNLEQSQDSPYYKL